MGLFVELIEFVGFIAVVALVGFRPLKSFRVKCLIFEGRGPKLKFTVRAQTNLPKTRFFVQALLDISI